MQAPFADPLSGLEIASRSLPLVGREVEMETLRTLLDSVVLNLSQGARALVISGEVGIGKSRLLAEIYKEARTRGFRVLEGYPYESGSMFPYLPFIEALRPVLHSSSLGQLHDYLGLSDMDEDGPTNTAGATSLIGTPLVTSLARLFPELPRMLHVTMKSEVLSADQEKFRLLDAVATVLERMSLEQPILLGIDNLQWADSASLELMMYLTVRLHSSRVALAGVTRPPDARQEHIDADVTTTTTATAAKALGDLMRHGLLLLFPLGVLRADAADQHLQALLPGSLSTILSQTLLNRAEGNPFFLEELVRMLTLNGHLAHRDGAWRIARPIDTNLPESITLAVEQRLQGMSTGCRELLRLAALFGRTFPQDALVEVCADSEDTLQSLVDEAMRAALIAKNPDMEANWDDAGADDEESGIDMLSLPQIALSQLAPPTYMFCQGIVQEVLSAEVPTQQARLLHGRIGAALEASYGSTALAHATELARHYVLGNEKAAALRWSLLAGEDAARQQAHREAISHFRLVLKLLEAGEISSQAPSPAQLHSAIGESWFKLGELEQAANAFQQALELQGEATYPSVGSLSKSTAPLQRAHIHRMLADVHRLQGKYELAVAHLQAAGTAFDRGISEERDAASESTTVFWFAGRSFPSGANSMTLERVSVTERILLLQAQATLDIFLNREREAESALWLAHQLATEVGDKGSQAFALHLIGWLRGWGEQIYEAIRLQEQAHELFVAIGDPFRAALGDQGLGIIYQALGEMEQARLYTLRGFERARRYGVRRILGWLHWNQGVMALASGQWTASEFHLQQAWQEAEANSDVRLKPVVMQAQAELHFRQGDWQKAERYFQEAIVSSANTEWYASTLALYGHFLAVTGRRAAARAQLDRAAAFPEPPGFAGDFYIPFLAEGYLHLNDTEKAATYIERIRKLKGFMYYGNSVDRVLGVVATLAGDWQMAEQDFENGLILCQRAKNQPEEAAILYEQARAALMQAGQDGRSGERVSRLCERARKLFLQYDMQRWVDAVGILQEGVRQLEQHDAALIARQLGTDEITKHVVQKQVVHPEYYLELSLTRRELEVLRLVAEGHTDREVADTLVISPRTVNRHLSNIFVKLDVPGRAAAVAYAIRQGLV